MRDHHSSKHHIVEAAGAEIFCQPVHDDRRSQVWRGNQLHAHGNVLNVGRGDNIILVVNNVPPALPSLALTMQEGDERDELWLMQSSSARTRHVRNAWLSEVTTSLQQRHDPLLCVLAEDRIAFRTWYLDHDHVRHCFEPRSWHATGPPASWEFQLRGIWYDQIDSFQSLRIVATAAFNQIPEILLIQGSTDYRGIHLHSPPPSGTLAHPIDIAVSTFPRISKEQVIALRIQSRNNDMSCCDLAERGFGYSSYLQEHFAQGFHPSCICCDCFWSWGCLKQLRWGTVRPPTLPAISECDVCDTLSGYISPT